MSYLSLARKYRPQNFDEIISQEHIATTLKNAIAMDRVAHAYLFAGPRGVGKTSAARILAKSLNCGKGPGPTPCGRCDACVEISRGTSLDVIEIDGASNRGIDEIRNLKQNVKFAPIRGKFRIYIIDEVHMLTQEAFNALLKTLEEPPAHVKFIFATTKPYKVLPTILSRCQRFDFRRIPIRDIAKKLKEIKKEEKLDLSDETIFLVAKAAGGSMRDAEIILDQLLSFAKGKVGVDDLRKVLGLLEQDTLFDLADCIINNEKDKTLSLVDGLMQSGRDPAFIASGIMEHFRNLMVARVAKDSARGYVALSEEDYNRLEAQSRRFSLDEILYITYTLSATMDLIKKTNLERIPLEIALVKLAGRERLPSIKRILERLALIEGKLSAPAGPQPETDAGPLNVSRELPEKSEEKVEESPGARPDAPAIPEEEVAAEKDILLLQKIKSSWSKILNFIKTRKISIATFLSDGALLKVKDNVLAIGFKKDNSLHKESLESDRNKKFVEEAIRSIVGEDVFLTVESMEEDQAGEAAAPAEMSGIEEGTQDAADSMGPRTANHIEPIVESAIDIFEGRVVDVRDTGRKEKK